MFQHYGLSFSDNWYTHETDPVVKNDKVTILWDFKVHTDKTIRSYRPDIIVKDYETQTCFLIDMTNSPERNTSVKKLEKLSKYKDLCRNRNCQDVALKDDYGNSSY